MRAIALLVLLVAGACRLPPPDSPGGKAIACTSDAVQRNWPRILPIVNSCVGTEPDASWRNCLIGLIDPAGGITEDVLACVVRNQGERFAAAAAGNPRDQVSARAAGRSETFIHERGYSFAP